MYSIGAFDLFICFKCVVIKPENPNFTYPSSEFVRSHTFYFEVTNLMLARTLTERVVQPGTKPNPDAHPPRGCPSNSLGPVLANMYSDHDARCRRHWEPRLREVERVPSEASQEESARRDIPIIRGQLDTKLLVSRESPFPPCLCWPGIINPVPKHKPVPPRQVPHPRVDCGWMDIVRTPRKKNCCVWCGRTQF